MTKKANKCHLIVDKADLSLKEPKAQLVGVSLPNLLGVD